MIKEWLALTFAICWYQKYSEQPTVTLNNKPIPYTNTTPTLGVAYDRCMTLGQYTDNINTKAETRLNVL